MVISHKHKFIYISVPRTASTSILASRLSSYNDEPFALRCSPIKLINKKFNVKNYFKFCFFRNPWDTLFSIYCCKRSLGPDSAKKFIGCREAQSLTFDEWVRLNLSILDDFGFNTKTMWNMCVDDKGNNIMDYIGRFENLKTDFDLIVDSIGLSPIELPFIIPEGRSPRDHYSKYYTKETRELVLKTFAKEIDFMGYTFG